jgi:hypothetical protein
MSNPSDSELDESSMETLSQLRRSGEYFVSDAKRVAEEFYPYPFKVGDYKDGHYDFHMFKGGIEFKDIEEIRKRRAAVGKSIRSDLSGPDELTVYELDRAIGAIQSKLYLIEMMTPTMEEAIFHFRENIDSFIGDGLSILHEVWHSVLKMEESSLTWK